jgi:hypothetical protein
MLLSIALRRNASGPVLFTTTKSARGSIAAEAAIRSAALTDDQAAAFKDFAAAAKVALPEMVHAS